MGVMWVCVRGGVLGVWGLWVLWDRVGLLEFGGCGGVGFGKMGKRFCVSQGIFRTPSLRVLTFGRDVV